MREGAPPKLTDAQRIPILDLRAFTLYGPCTRHCRGHVHLMSCPHCGTDHTGHLTAVVVMLL